MDATRLSDRYATQIKSLTSGSSYDLDDVRWEVQDEIVEAIERGNTRGSIEVAGSVYAWHGVKID